LNARAVKGSVVGVAHDDLLLVTRVVRLNGGHVQRGGEVVDDGVEHRLDAAVLERRAAEHRVDLAVDRELANGALDLGDGELFAGEVLLHEVVVGFGDGLEEELAVLGGLVDEVGRDLFDGVLGAHLDVTLGVAAPGQCTHLDEVDNTFEGVLGADRQLDDERLRAEALDDRVDGVEEIGAELVHLVDEADAGHVVLVGLAPDGLGLGLNALLAVEHGDGAVEDAERTLHLDGEVNVAGVSMMLIWFSAQKQVVAADVMVMPRSCSCAIQSMVEAPSCVSPIL
jgi:hypothetical protein